MADVNLIDSATPAPRARPDAKNDARRAGEDVIVHFHMDDIDRARRIGPAVLRLRYQRLQLFSTTQVSVLRG